MTPERNLDVLVVDDERLARERLEQLVERTDSIRLLDSVSTGKEAIRVIREQAPDLVFLDVQMPGLSGLEVIEELGPENMPLVIFVTAYDEYAVQAFQVAALDYLLKPFENERFHQALERALEAATLHEMSDFRSRLEELLDEHEQSSSTDTPAETPSYIERIAVETRGRVRVVPVSDVVFFSADGSYIEIHTDENTHLIRERMQELEEKLDPGEFFRIHRSFIVRLDAIQSLLVGGGGSYHVQLEDGRKLKVSRNRKEQLEKRLGLNTSR